MAKPPNLEIIDLAQSLGFDVCRFTSASLEESTGENLKEFVDLERHGEMAWMKKTIDRRHTPTAMWEDAKSAIVLGMNYGPNNDPLEILKHKNKAAISVYAQNRDYHDIIKGRLKQIAQRLASRFDAQVKVFVDTAPLMEKPLAAKAGLGWQGKHTNLVSREQGSWLFLGVILTDQIIEPDEPEIDRCGSCSSCLDICPTNAFPAPYQLDARRCISYLTIEYDGIIPHEFREPMANRIYGCDDCLAVCPWNKFAQTAHEIKLKPRDDLKAPSLSELVLLDDAAFRKLFSGSPIKRIGRNKFIRNILIAIGNSADISHVDSVSKHLTDQNETVRATAVWALSQLADAPTYNALKKIYMPQEPDALVKAEWLGDAFQQQDG